MKDGMDCTATPRKDDLNGFIVMKSCLIRNEKRRRLVESINFD